MSFSMTTEAVRRREKTVTRRTGWDFLEPADLFVPVEKAMGLKKGERHVALWSLCRCVSNVREALNKLVLDPEYGRMEMIREGFPGMNPAEFIEMFCAANGLNIPLMMRPCDVPWAPNRIGFEYVEASDAE
jgi:hypothetical protein